jgi:hypothetical protein
LRIIAEIPHALCKISVFYMNQKYIVKFEQEQLEQSFKISEIDFVITGIDDIKKIVSEIFINEVLERFSAMKDQLNRSLKYF